MGGRFTVRLAGPRRQRTGSRPASSGQWPTDRLGYPATWGQVGCRRVAARRCATRAGRPPAATATGAAESHSYCPPAWTYASTAPETTAMIFAPAEPSGTRSAPISVASSRTNPGGLVRLTTILILPPVGPPASQLRAVPAGAVATVLKVRPWAGSATAPAASRPRGRPPSTRCTERAGSARSHRATWTAQSVRPSSPNSRVPSSGSTIQTRRALQPHRVVLALLGQQRIAAAMRRERSR